ncbi:MBOAT domain containing protein [Trichuris trichiura]|uniref:Lysophospholipid acyltransferase 5 n=1 Tax=Trichuris trichiura TaxID=36087 RepID=A0A077Z803_TRITR|nr:MBOAT domain containing protein [Trichuris trichiura]
MGSFWMPPCIDYPLSRFRQLINGEYSKPGTEEPPDSVVPAIGRLLPGLGFAIGHAIFHPKWPTEFCLTDEFTTYSFWERAWYIIVWFRFIIMRYQAVWLIAEGVCILNGLGHNIHPKTGEQLWDGVRNFRLSKFELSATFQGIIESFNYNTNQWALNYCFKRLRFLGSKNLSHVLTLAFLALWHGTNSGYFVCFLFEYVCVIAERQFTRNRREKWARQVRLSPPETLNLRHFVDWFKELVTEKRLLSGFTGQEQNAIATAPPGRRRGVLKMVTESKGVRPAAVSPLRQCIACDADFHGITSCPAFLGMDITERLAVIRNG